MDPVNDLQQWNLIVGFLLPLVTAVIIRQRWTDGAKAIAGFALAFVASLGVVYFEGNLDTSNVDAVVSSFLTIITVSIATYKGFWQKTEIAPNIERATGITPWSVTLYEARKRREARSPSDRLGGRENRSQVASSRRKL